MEPIKDFERAVEGILAHYQIVLPQPLNEAVIYQITAGTNRVKTYTKRELHLQSGAWIQLQEICLYDPNKEKFHKWHAQLDMREPVHDRCISSVPTLSILVNYLGTIDIPSMFEDNRTQDPELENLERLIYRVNKTRDGCPHVVTKREVEVNNARTETARRMILANRDQQLLRFAKGPNKYFSHRDEFIQSLASYIERNSSMMELSRLQE